MLENLKALVAALGVDWLDFKIFVEHASNIDHDALHVIVGVAIQLLLVIATHSSLARVWPWGVVLLAELANEWNDLRVDNWPEIAKQWGEGTKDIGLTMLLPTVLLILARWKPWILRLK